MFEVCKDRCTPEELVILCPVPGCGDSSGNRSINLKNGKTNCWRCNIGGDFVKWARYLGYGIDDDGAAATTTDDVMLLLDPPKPVDLVPVISEIKLPNGFETCYDNPDSVYTREIGKMALRKNLEPEDLVNAGVGFTRTDNKWESFAIFPVMEYERVVYYQGRTYWDDPDMSTKRFPSRQEAPLSSKYWIYNIDALRHPGARVAVVVESILNVLSLQKKFDEEGVGPELVPICVFKHAVSKNQFLKMLRYKGIQEICLLFDLDATNLSWEDAKKFDDNVRITIAEMPFREDNMRLDPNDDVNAAWEAIQNRQKFLLASKTARNIRATEIAQGNPDITDWIADLYHPVYLSTH
jgi:hypothetical protein